jgi:threonine/homoserine/homoserine lactone efflux protein
MFRGVAVTITPAYLVASLVLAVTPGPGVFYVVTRSVTQGRLAGLMSVAGVATGNLGNAIAASLGLATLFAVSTLAFTVVKFAGALYLIYLGIRTLMSRPTAPDPDSAGLPAVPLRKLYLDGLMVALFNPKTAIFFAAFVPQFLDAESATPAGTVSLSVVFVLVAATTDCLYALLAGSAGHLIRSRDVAMRSGRFVSGGAFIALGLFAAFSKQSHG